MGWYTEYLESKDEYEYQLRMEQERDRQIRDRNVYYALLLGVIDWFQYLEYWSQNERY